MMRPSKTLKARTRAKAQAPAQDILNALYTMADIMHTMHGTQEAQNRTMRILMDEKELSSHRKKW